MKKKELLRLIESLKEDVDFLANRINLLEEKMESVNRGGLNIPMAPCPPFTVTCNGVYGGGCNIPAAYPTTSPVRRLDKSYTVKEGGL